MGPGIRPLQKFTTRACTSHATTARRMAPASILPYICISCNHISLAEPKPISPKPWEQRSLGNVVFSFPALAHREWENEYCRNGCWMKIDCLALLCRTEFLQQTRYLGFLHDKVSRPTNPLPKNHLWKLEKTIKTIKKKQKKLFSAWKFTRHPHKTEKHLLMETSEIWLQTARVCDVLAWVSCCHLPSL